jgi:3-dehydroquinate synthase
MKTLRVSLPAGAPGYPIRIGQGIMDAELRVLAEPWARELVVVVTNETLDRLFPSHIPEALKGLPARIESCVIPDGERYKTLETLSRIYDRMMALGANRQTLLIAFGGGVVGDVAGFAAGTFMRGIRMLQVPTTLVAQVDSSIGGKTAVNHPLAKNAIGVFKQPEGVVIDLRFLETLPQRELRAGLFELIKHGIIADRELFAFLEKQVHRLVRPDWANDGAFWEEALTRSVAVKCRIVESDETESGPRAALNFGHTLGHLIETLTHYESYLHGEAVGVGMLFAAYLSRAWGHLPESDFGRLRALLEPLVAPVRLPALDEAAFTELLLHDKKSAQRSVRYVLLRGLGEVFIRERTEPGEIWPVFRQFVREHATICQVQAA